VVHGDYRIDKLLLHPERPEALAALDWKLPTLGHPLAYLSYQCWRGLPPRRSCTAASAAWTSWLAANLQGVAKRELDGMGSSGLAQQSGAQAPALAELRWRFAARRHR
jgi:aminoglycoside phosphotransferase (APT) family kinase protein